MPTIKQFDTLLPAYNDANSREAYLDFSKPESMRNLRYFENHYGCSGVCDVPLFYLTKSVSEGPPSEDCAVSVIHAMKGKASIALLALIGMLSFWWAALSAMPSCCGKKKSKYGDESVNLKGKHYEMSEDISGMNTTRDQTILK